VADIRLPDGTRIEAFDRRECAFLFDEIFVREVYRLDGLPPGGTVVDVGAHVGLFALWAQRRLSPARLLALEPIPETYSALEDNAKRYFPASECLRVGAGAEAGLFVFRHYPRAVGWSTMKPHETEVRRALEGWISRAPDGANLGWLRLLERVAPSFRRWFLRRVLDRLFETAREVTCEVTTLSRLIETRELPRIDFLKIDAEGAEFEVLRGIDPDHWSRIGRVAAEVEDRNGVLAETIRLLESRFRVVRIRQEPELEGSPYHLVLADGPRQSGSQASPTPSASVSS
jgi:FkbM family methyltransferase